MKEWKNAEVVELNIKDTANGLLPVGFEFWWITNDFSGCPNTPEKPNDGPKPGDDNPTGHRS